MSDQPLLQPRIIRLLKDRPRLISFGLREDVLDELDAKMCQRRSPQSLADKLSDVLVNEASDSMRPAIRRRAEQRVSKMNETVFQNL